MCENITLGEYSAAYDGLITFGNQCGSQGGLITFGNGCAKYNGHIVIEKYSGRGQGSQIIFGEGCAAGCDSEFNIPKINVIYPSETNYMQVPTAPTGKFNGGKIYIGSACATGGGTIILGKYCAYNVGRIDFGDRCASSLLNTYSKGGNIILGDLCAYAGFLTFGSKCSYDCRYPKDENGNDVLTATPMIANIVLNECVAYSGNVSIASGCCYYGGNITIDKFSGCSGNVIIGQQTASDGGSVNIGEGCGVESGVLKIDQISANSLGQIIIGPHCAAAGIVNIGSFCAQKGNIEIGQWGAYNGGQIGINFACQNIKMGEYCAANAGKINIFEHSTDLFVNGQQSGSITLGNHCAKNSGRIIFESMCAQGGNITLKDNCALYGGVINFGIGCASYGGEINLKEYCAYNFGRINILNLCGVQNGIITLNTYCGSENGDILLNNYCAQDGQIILGDYCGIQSGRIQIGTESAYKGIIQIGNQCGQQIGHIIISNRCAANGGQIIIGNECGLDGNIEIGHGCATASLKFTDNNNDGIDDTLNDYNQAGIIKIGNQCGSARGWISIDRYCCSYKDGNAGYIEISDQCGSFTGKINIESYCAANGQYVDGEYITGVIKIGSTTSTLNGQQIKGICAIYGGDIQIKSMNADNANIEIESLCILQQSILTVQKSGVQNQSKLLIKEYIGVQENSVIQIGELRDQYQFTLGSSIQEINQLLWKLPLVSTKKDEEDVIEYKAWDFDNITNIQIPTLQEQGNVQGSLTNNMNALVFDENGGNSLVKIKSFKNN